MKPNRFKFRVWDKIHRNLSYLKHRDFSWLGENALEEPSKYIVMQSTGLLDKNGKEIFDGDICKHSYYPNDVVVFTWDNELLSFKSTVVSDGIYCEDCFFIASDYKKYEIIGNKLQNPELLK